MKKRVFALIDCNNFFVSCERIFRPDLWHKPVAVLSNNDGCIVARSNQVKALGIPMAAPYFQWQKELTEAGVTLFSANFPLYGDISQRIVNLIRDACPEVEVYSVDESFVELTDMALRDYDQWARELRYRILQWIGVPVAIGVAPTKTLAKAAAEYAKKHPEGIGIHVVHGERERLDLIKWLPITDVWGFGWRSRDKLHNLGITTAYDIAIAPAKWVQSTFTIRGRKTQLELQGVPAVEFESLREPQQSLARTRTFSHRIRNYHELESAIANFAAVASAKLRAEPEVAGGVVTFISTGKHAEITRSVSALTKLSEATQDTATIMKAALANLQQIYDPDFGYKRAGVVLVDLHSLNAWQANMFVDRPQLSDKSRQLMRAVDAINERYGTRLIQHATETLSKDWHSKRTKRSPSYTTSWHELAAVKA